MNFTHFSSTPDAPWTQPAPASSPAESDLDLQLTSQRDQTWWGFGACFNEMGWSALQSLESSEREAILDRFFAPNGDLQFSYCRLPIGASDYANEWYSLNEHDGDLAIERDEQFLRSRRSVAATIVAANLTKNELLRFT